MSKLQCECLGVISDSSDNLPYKAYIVPDTLIESLVDRAVALIMNGHGKDTAPDEESRIWAIIGSTLHHFSQRSYQCRIVPGF